MEQLLKRVLGERSPYAVDAITHGNTIPDNNGACRYTKVSLVLYGKEVVHLADELSQEDLLTAICLCGLDPAPLATVDQYAKRFYRNGIPDAEKIVQEYAPCNPSPPGETAAACRARYKTWINDVVRQMEDLKRLALLAQTHVNERRVWESTKTVTLNLGQARKLMRDLEVYKSRYESLRAAVLQLAREAAEKIATET